MQARLKVTLLWYRPLGFFIQMPTTKHKNNLIYKIKAVHEVYIKTRSPPVLLPFIGQVTEQTTVKWSIAFIYPMIKFLISTFIPSHRKRKQESYCIFNGITSNLTIIHCTYSYVALIVLPTVFSMWACIRAWAIRPELIRVSVNQWCPVSGVEHTNCDATMPPIVFSMAWYKIVKQHSLVVFM